MPVSGVSPCSTAAVLMGAPWPPGRVRCREGAGYGAALGVAVASDAEVHTEPVGCR